MRKLIIVTSIFCFSATAVQAEMPGASFFMSLMGGSDKGDTDSSSRSANNGDDGAGSQGSDDSTDSNQGSNSGGSSSWIGKSPEYFLNALPAPPETGCPAKGADKSSSEMDSGTPSSEKDAFMQKFFKVRKELTAEVTKRRRAVKKWNEQNSKKMMENVVDMPGFEGKSQAEMKRMSKAEKKKMAEQMMQDKYGVSMDDLKAQKKANRGGKVEANVDFAKTMAGEQQANDLMKSKSQRDADKKKITDTGKLVKEQKELSQQLYTTVVGRSLAKLEELAKDKQRKSLQEQVYDKEEVLAKMLGNYYTRPKEIDFQKMAEIIKRAANTGDTNVDLPAEMGYTQEPAKPAPGNRTASCDALNAQADDIYMQKLSYCRYTAAKFIDILKDFQRALVNAQPRYRKLDQISSDLQKAQTGIGLPEAAMGLSGLEAMQQYAALLGQAYANDPGAKRDPETDAGFCGGSE